MRIWQATENDNQIRFYWFATKAEALAHKREYDRDPPIPEGTCEVEAMDANRFAPGRAGLVEAMNYVITLTCFNEG